MCVLFWQRDLYIYVYICVYILFFCSLPSKKVYAICARCRAERERERKRERERERGKKRKRETPSLSLFHSCSLFACRLFECADV